MNLIKRKFSYAFYSSLISIICSDLKLSSFVLLNDLLFRVRSIRILFYLSNLCKNNARTHSPNEKIFAYWLIKLKRNAKTKKKKEEKNTQTNSQYREKTKECRERFLFARHHEKNKDKRVGEMWYTCWISIDHSIKMTIRRRSRTTHFHSNETFLLFFFCYSFFCVFLSWKKQFLISFLKRNKDEEEERKRKVVF